MSAHRLSSSTAAPLVASLALMAATPCFAAPQALVVLDATGAPIERAVVAVQVKGASPVAPPGTSAQMAQRQRQFAPQVLAVQAGTAVHFPNFDTVRHHVYSFSPARKFEIKLYAGTPAAPVVFDKPGTATLGCNIHDQMIGFIHVVDTPYFAVTDATGTATLDLPPGSHGARVWHADMGETSAGQSFELKAPAGATTLRLSP